MSKITNESPDQTPKDILNDLHALVSEAETMMGGAVTEHTADAMTALRSRFDAAHERMAQLCSCAKQKVIDGAKCTDTAIRANPYQSLAIAAGVGALIGILVGRRSK